MMREEYKAARVYMAGLSVPELMAFLSSPDLRTRFIAEMCLRDAANT